MAENDDVFVDTEVIDEIEIPRTVPVEQVPPVVQQQSTLPTLDPNQLVQQMFTLQTQTLQMMQTLQQINNDLRAQVRVSRSQSTTRSNVHNAGQSRKRQRDGGRVNQGRQVQIGDRAEHRPIRLRQGPQDYRVGVQCWECKEEGHYRNQCPQLARRRGKQPRRAVPTSGRDNGRQEGSSSGGCTNTAGRANADHRDDVHAGKLISVLLLAIFLTNAVERVLIYCGNMYYSRR